MKITISVNLKKTGFSFYLNQKEKTVNYPIEVWQSLPEALQLSFSEFLTFILTLHLSFRKDNYLIYNFPNPLGEAFFYYGLVLSMSENLIDTDAHKTSEYIRIVLNSYYKIKFIGIPRLISHQLNIYKPKPNSVLLPHSFGKDSLLTYGVSKELGMQIHPIYFIEPTNIYENNHKKTLINKFSQEFGVHIDAFDVPVPELKQNPEYWWGWDLLLTQYTVFLIPFLYYYRPSYLFWSNEFNCNETIYDKEGFVVSSTFDQSQRWVHVLNSVLRIYGCNVLVGSLLESISEMAVLYLLHQRYPDLGKYQTSCINEHESSKTQRWCGACYECARVYVSLVGLGFDPKLVDFKNNMLTKFKRNLFYIFDNNNGDLSKIHNQFKFTKEEKLFAFYLAYKQGRRDGLMEEFVERYLPHVKRRQNNFKEKYLSLHPGTTMPQSLKNKVYSLYKNELVRLKKKLS